MPSIKASGRPADQTTGRPASHNRTLRGLVSVGMDLDAVRTFVAVADTGRFSEAADELSITQQAVSKRIAALERELGVRLFARTARGAQLTEEGQAFLPHARDLLEAEHRAAASVRPGRRALRVDVIGPYFGIEPLLDAVARSPGLATFVGEQTSLTWPSDCDLRRVAVRNPTPVYPHSLIWRGDNPHPALAQLRDHLHATQPSHADAWTPQWARLVS